jgi:hypothetical protein
MSEVKEVTVALSEADSKALLGGGGKSRRRRTRKATEEGAVPIEEPAIPATSVSAPMVVKMNGGSSEPISPLAPAPPTIPPVVMPAVSSTSVVGGGATPIPAGTVNIKPKNAPTSTAPSSATVANIARILPNKKRPVNVPAVATLKKPRLIVEPAAAPAAKTRRKFRERSIKITVKPTAASRKFRKTLKSRVDSMPIAAVRRVLMRKGIMKPHVGGTADPPPEMMRSMLKDYLLLNAI